MDGQLMSIHIDTLSTRATINAFVTFTYVINNNTMGSSLIRLEKGFHLQRIKVKETLINLQNKLGT